MKRVLLSWRSGKDSAWTLHLLRKYGDCDIVGLLTTLNSEFDRVAMHGTRRSVPKSVVCQLLCAMLRALFPALP